MYVDFVYCTDLRCVPVSVNVALFSVPSRIIKCGSICLRVTHSCTSHVSDDQGFCRYRRRQVQKTIQYKRSCNTFNEIHGKYVNVKGSAKYKTDEVQEM